MKAPFVGCALIDHRLKKTGQLFCRVVLIKPNLDLVVIAPFPQMNSMGRPKHYVPAPVHMQLSSLQEAIDNQELSVVKFETPHHWLLTADHLRSGRFKFAGVLSRQDPRKWVRRKACAYGRIRPFVHGRCLEEILLDEKLSGWPTRRSKELGLKGASQVQRDLNAYILGLGERNALMPWYARCGAPGKLKFSGKKTGRPPEFSDLTAQPFKSHNCDMNVRRIFALGWRKHKKLGVSARTAFIRTLEEFFCEKVRWTNANCFTSKLKPEAHSYSLAQFTRWGQRGLDYLNDPTGCIKETEGKRLFLRRMGKTSTKSIAVNGQGFIDSTSCDQTLVSHASRLQTLMSPWRTELVGSNVGYLFGLHVGFESPSAATALMTILHGADSKVEFCARYGITITEDDWLPMVFRRYVTDNGEGKNETTMRTIEELELGVSYGAAYDATNKPLVESDHRRYQAHLDHTIPGATMGKRKVRGEPNRSLLARLNFHEYMHLLIKQVLYFNNEEVITLPTIEMRTQEVEPTRRGVVKWLVAKGYMSSVPTDLAILRIKCLPKIRVVMHGNGLHVFDPSFNGKRLIPDLVYRSEWLLRSGLLEKASRRRWETDAHINPSDLSQIWINHQGLKELRLASEDPDLMHMTLTDWLFVSQDDRFSKFLSRVRKVEHGVQQANEIKRNASAANSERKRELDGLNNKPSKVKLSGGKRESTVIEQAAQTGVPRLAKIELKASENQSTSLTPTPDPGVGYMELIAALRDRK